MSSGRKPLFFFFATSVVLQLFAVHFCFLHVLSATFLICKMFRDATMRCRIAAMHVFSAFASVALIWKRRGLSRQPYKSLQDRHF